MSNDKPNLNNISGISFDLSIFNDNRNQNLNKSSSYSSSKTLKIKSNYTINSIPEPDTNKYLRYLIKAYEAFHCLNYTYCIEILKLIISFAKSVENYDIVCETLLNISVVYSLKGDIAKAFQYIHESQKLLNQLITNEDELENRTQGKNQSRDL